MRAILVHVHVIHIVESRLPTAAKECLELVHAQRLAFENIWG